MAETIIGERQTRRAAAWLAGPLAGLLFVPSVIGFAAARTDGYSHATKAVSELGAIGAPSAAAFNLLAFIAPGLLIAWFGLSLARLGSNRVGPMLLVGSGLLLALAGVSPGDVDDYGAATTIGHAIGAVGSGALWAAALFWLRPLLSLQFGLVTWGRITPWFLLFMVVHIGWQVAFRATGVVLPGWGQRIGFLGYFLWFAITGILLWRQHDAVIENSVS